MKDLIGSVMFYGAMPLLLLLIGGSPYWLEISHHTYKCKELAQALDGEGTYVRFDGCYIKKDGKVSKYYSRGGES